MRIAVLLTTFNRKAKTLSCLANLQQQQLPADVVLDVFLTDDASSDGTAEAVRELFPQTNLFQGNGQFYWAGGMRYTWREARRTTPDYYLLLNDDTDLFPTTISTLLQTAIGQKKPAVVVGSTADRATGELSYGGWKLRRRGIWKSERCFSKTLATDCDFANANILLVPEVIVESIGILADHFTHSLADYDYTCNVRKAGFGLVVAPGVLGYCTDDHGANWKSQATTLRERYEYMKSPKGLAYKEYLRFIRDHFPLSYPSAFAKLWLKTFFPFVWDKFKQ